ncbi:MAG: hypothetical protein JW937_01485 [Candidatus Omnitrophica bacterium]|nr:hypothetical protein [Candidatus Omnitrophota bacterium]
MQIIRKSLLALSVIAFLCADVCAQDLETRYFDVTVHEDVDIVQLYSQIHVNEFEHLDILVGGDLSDPTQGLKECLDALYLEVSDILDIHLRTVRYKIEIYSSKLDLAEVSVRNYGYHKHGSAYYSFERNTLYFCAEELRTGILGHEMAHAIVCSYFVVPPPEKAQEILCGYVEFQLNKKLAL